MLTLICGLPNAGKTTYSSRFKNVIHLDDIPRHGHQFKECDKKASAVVGDVCVEGVYNSVKERKALIKACEHQSPKVCIWLDTDVNECVRRENQYRKRTVGMVLSHHKSFQPPTLDEGWDEVIVVR